ncbi:NADH-quinone oxidoreductase subunit M [ANME-1 cluster archaeon AG-394-G21]|nr:NADH-quinone oxidoreductase subunit M [ANME-1 cluster archaeon AG-394-G21]
MMPYILLQTMLVPVIAALFILLTRRILGRKVRFIPCITLLYTTALLFIAGISVYQGTPIHEDYGWGPYVSFGLLADGLSLPVALIINIICTALSFYSLHYVEHRIEIIYGEEDEKTQLSYHTTYFWLYFLFPISFLGICFATNLIIIYLFIEMLVIPLYFIMSYFGYVERFRVAVMCFLWGIVGGTFVLFGSVLVYSQMGSFEISELHTLAGNPMVFWIGLLMFIGLFTKMAIFPLHVWMPSVHAEHPTCIAGLLAVYANIAAYVIVRVLILPLHEDIKVFGTPIMILALITIVYGAILTIAQNDVKRLCACSTISQISYSLLGLGALTVWSVEGGLFYFVSHILGKAILFSTAGIVVYVTGIRDMNKMGGLIRKMPVSAVLWITAASILTGVPLTSGFTAKWILFTGVFAAYPTSVGLSIAILGILSTILTAVYTFWAAKRIFFGPLKPELANKPEIRDPPLTMSVPLLILAVISFIIGLYPKPLLELFHSVIGLI